MVVMARFVTWDWGWGSDLFGNDYLNGGNGHDSLTGGQGKDILTGESGLDIFNFDSVTESPAGGKRDIITDFTKDKWEPEWWGPHLIPGDKIDLSTIDANVNSSASGNQSFSSGQLKYDSFTGVLTAM
jgi:Ca2+-binding RTX toxin-like protein